MSAPTRSYTLPGPTRQFVATETVIWGITGVEVKTGVGDKVTVGVSVGGSGVNVLVGEPKPVMGMIGWAVCDSAATTVCTTVVPMRFGSGVEIAGKVHAREAINRILTDRWIGFSFNIFSSFRATTE
jgi:hypothetical protein